MATATDLPLSMLSSSANWSARAVMPSAIRQIIRCRSAGVVVGHGPSSNARRAARTARSTSSGPLCGTVVMTCSVAGSTVSNRRPETDSTH